MNEMETIDQQPDAPVPLWWIIVAAVLGGIACCIASIPILVLTFGFIADGMVSDANAFSLFTFAVGVALGAYSAATRKPIILCILGAGAVLGFVIVTAMIGLASG